MSDHRCNALALKLSDRDVGMFFAAHVSTLFAAEARGVPIVAPATVIEYMRRFKKRLAKAQTCSNPTNRRRSLAGAAALFRARKGWRAEFPRQAEACALALEALTADQARSVGRPPGLVSRAIENLIEDDLAQGQPIDVSALLSAGSGNAPSPGRRRLLVEVLRLAEEGGTPLTLREAMDKIRAYAKDWKNMNENREPARKKIPAAGM